MSLLNVSSSDEEEEVGYMKLEDQYQYTFTLKSDGEIRLLHLNPGKLEEPIEAYFFLKPFWTDQKYSALSYTWGKPKPRKFIYICNDPTSDRRDNSRQWMAVTPNLEAALRQIRHPRKALELWVDALCINQDEESEEKGFQIQQMAQIYSQAEQVIVWLGEASNDSSTAMRFIKDICDLSKLDHIAKDHIHSKEWKALASLMRRPWFNRRWVVQELAMAKSATVHCGAEKVNWSDFADAVALFEAKYEDIQLLFDRDTYVLGEIQGLGAHSLMTASHNLFAHSKQGTKTQRLVTLEYLLCTLSAFQVTNPWDTVYSLLGLAKDVRRQVGIDKEPAQEVEWIDINVTGEEKTLYLSVDYKKPILDVFVAVTTHSIEQSGTVDIICRPWAPSANEVIAAAKFLNIVPEAYKPPSWIRDTIESEFAPRSEKLGVQYDRINAKSFLGNPGAPTYNTAANSHASRLNILGPNDANRAYTLILDGYFVDYVGSLGGCASSGHLPPDWPALASWKDHQKSVPPDPFWRTLVADRRLDGGRPPAWYRRACEHAWSDSASPGLDLGRLLRNCGSSMTTDFIRRVRQTVWNRQMFLTRDKDLLGLGPSSSRSSLIIQTGDLIFVLYGCSVPVILRPSPNSDYYNLIGECYVNGVMDGEAFMENVRAGTKPTKVWLR